MPRYHFCGAEAEHYARPAYRQGGAHVCRLVALAPVSAGTKPKWLHALSLVPTAACPPAQLAVEPAGTTESPFPYTKIAAAARSGGGGGGGASGGGGGDGPPAKRPKREFLTDARSWISQSCWFCLSSAQFESHLVTSVGDEAYVCLAKGPLLPHHALVLPIAHRQCSLHLTAEEAREVAAYVAALREWFEARGQAVLLFERYMGNSQFEHMHVQVVPLPADLAPRAREAFVAHGARLGIRFENLPPAAKLADAMGSPEPYFLATMPDGSQLLHRMASNPRKHPLQFGREAVANLLGEPRRADWKACLQAPPPGDTSSTTKDLEQRDADEFKKGFASFDPTLK
jgi:diadenosine tetraphosphate (Ap4A) HIT family hydrolase